MYIIIGKSNCSYCSDLRAELNKKNIYICIYNIHIYIPGAFFVGVAVVDAGAEAGWCDAAPIINKYIYFIIYIVICYIV